MAELPYGATGFQEARWSLPLLRQLDWKRMQELVALLLHRAGFQAEISWIRPDAGVVLTVTNPNKGGRLDALVQCPPWAMPNVDSAALKELYNSVLQEGASRGIFITTGEFSEEARQFAKMRPLELIDGVSMLRTIERMPAEEQAYHLRMLTVGPYTIPTCPACGQKLELRDETDFDPNAQLKDVVYKDRQTVSSEVYARTLTIKSGAEVQFLKTVNVQDLVVQGRATGNITVQGKLTVAKGGVLYGLVAARTISMEDGGSLEAEARVLNAGEIQPVRSLPVQQIWRCGKWPKCRGQLPLR
jgi:Restriction endonuclease/Polymer-forming cytoskeletal